MDDHRDALIEAARHEWLNQGTLDLDTVFELASHGIEVDALINTFEEENL